REKARNLKLLKENNFEEIQLFIDVMSLSLYPFIIKEAIGKVFELTEEQSNMIAHDRRKRISEYISSALEKQENLV
ncbi:MAG: hypothetical protein GX102_05640, partial [Porphyromonadaceae bacterium]|nr:hypothetical protein [Porphyromonadaceae bacterium]